MAMSAVFQAPPRVLSDARRHPILEKGTFEQLHRNEIIETRPHTIHFGGFQIHKDHSHKLRVVNISSSSMRVLIIGPSTPYFRIEFEKKGLLAPGMSEEVTVTFTPHEWRYYHDSVKISCGGLCENLVVPIHAYPSANDITLPRIIDFGCVGIGTSRTKVIPLSCKIPIQFEFEIKILEAHPDVEVAPLEGVIPADGITNVVVTFLPAKHRTARAELQFHIAQFDFEPVTVTVVGSSRPDALKDEIVQSAKSEEEAAAATLLQETMAKRVQALKQKKARVSIEAKPPAIGADDADHMVDGVKVPTRFNHSSINFVLNQTAGKLPLKDRLSFIKEQGRAEETRKSKAKEESSKLECTVGDEDGTEDGDAQAQEVRFEMRYREVEGRIVGRGGKQLDESQIESVREACRSRHAHTIKAMMTSDIARTQSVLLEERVAVPCAFVPALRPKWDEHSNDMFSMRLQVIDRLVRAGAKLLMYRRARRTADLLRAAMDAAGVNDRASCAIWADAEQKGAAMGNRTVGHQTEKPRATGAPTATSARAGVVREGDDVDALGDFHIPLSFVLPCQLPTMPSGMKSEDREPVEVEPLGNFEVVEPLPIRPRLDFKVLPYQRHVAPPAAAYMRPNERPRLEAALEEHLVCGPRGSAFDGAEEPISMPDTCLLPPLPPNDDALSIFVPSPECRTYIPTPEFCECDPEFQLAMMPPTVEPLEMDPLLVPNLQGLETPWLASWRRTRQLQDPFMYFDPAPCSFVEGGGSQGSCLSADAGGERFSFMPVGGLKRDLPSDTDDDDREPFTMHPPSEEELNAAVASMEQRLVSELWEKQGQVEELLRKEADSRNKALRERFGQLNEFLQPEHKLYLG